MKKTLSFAALMLLVTVSASAYDFKAGSLCYNIVSGTNNVRVTYEKSTAPYYSNLSGAITIPQTVKNGSKTYTVVGIEGFAFKGCTDITSASLASTVQSIGSSAFDQCSALTSINIPDGVKTISEYCFERCESLKSIVLPNSVTKIDDMAFRWCEALESVTMSDNVTYVGIDAFTGCITNSIRIPAGVTKIEQRAFSTSSLDTIYCEVQDPSQVEINSWAFMSVNKQTCLLVVPEGTVDAFREAEVWKDFVNIVDHVDPAPEPITPTLTPYDVYTPNNAQTDPAEDYYKLFDKDRTTKWCVDNNTNTWETIWVDFKSNTAITPTGYIMTTGNDTYSWKGRNPKAWKIYAKAKESDEWTTIVDVSDGAAIGLGTNNTTDYSFPIDGLSTKYQFFRFEVSEVCDKGGWHNDHYVFQLAELALIGQPAAGIPGDVDGNGKVNVSDVTTLVNMILGLISKDEARGDVDGNGKVNVSDVTALINIILGIQ